MAQGKQLVFRYNGDKASEDLEMDLLEEIPVPTKGSVVERKGSRWSVAEVMVEQMAGDRLALPIYRVFLTGPIT